MTTLAEPALAHGPEWIVAEMPPGYRNRLLEIERLSADLRAMDDVGRVLWATGEPLRQAVAAIFTALKGEIEGPGAGGSLGVKIGDDGRRLLVLVSSSAATIRRTDEELTRAFQAMQFAGAADRVVLVANNDAATRPADRPDPVSPDALEVLQRMGVNVMTTLALFTLWRQSLDDLKAARKTLDRLHAQDGGAFVVPASAQR